MPLCHCIQTSDVKRFFTGKKPFFTGKKSIHFLLLTSKLQILQVTSGAACNKSAFDLTLYVKWQNCEKYKYNQYNIIENK